MIFVLAIVAGCGNAANADGDDGTTGPDPTSSDPNTSVASDGLCVPGYEGCPCFDDARCISGLACLSDHCVKVPDGPSTDDTTPLEDSSSGAGESSSSDAMQDTGTSSSDDGSSSSGPAAVCVDDDTYCEDGDLQTCVGGQWSSMTCEDACALTGYGASGCLDADSCGCAGHSDALCDAAAYQHCICIDALYGRTTCNELEMEYQACFEDTTAGNTCWSMYDVQTLEDCQQAVAECGA